MDSILSCLFLGSYADARDDEAIEVSGIRGTFNIAECAYVGSVPVRHCPIADERYYPPSVWARLVDALTDWVGTAGPVLVHCRLGRSRAPSLVVVYLVAHGYHATLEGALAAVTQQRSIVTIHPETWRGVRAWREAWVPSSPRR